MGAKKKPGMDRSLGGKSVKLSGMATAWSAKLIAGSVLTQRMSDKIPTENTNVKTHHRVELKQLAEALDVENDVTLFDAALAEGAGPTLPSDLAEAIIAGALHPLTAWRKAAGLTQGALAKLAHTRAATISDIESGKIDPRYSTVAALATILGVDVDSIMP